MSSITTRQFRILADHMTVYEFMLEIYDPHCANGVAAPFLEYALSSDWMNKSYTHRDRLWLDGEKIVAFCFYENPVSDVYFTLRPGYEFLAPEMIAYAESDMPRPDGKHQLVIFGAQKALTEAAQRAGYQRVACWTELDIPFDKPLEYPLPAGYRFAAAPLDAAKISRCCWRGFNHEAEEGPWHGDGESELHLMQAPHATVAYDVAIEDEAGEYVCFAGMWWVPENRLAYMEPLCTVPEHRRKGLAAAALSELHRRLAPLGATHMTGGFDPFYAAIGFEPAVEWCFWQKP